METNTATLLSLTLRIVSQKSRVAYQNTKKCLFGFIVCFVTANAALAQTNIYDSIYIGARWRTFMTHLPANYDALTRYPLVLVFHGGAGSYASISNESKLSLKADTAGFIAVYPEGVKSSGFRSWNGGACCGPAVSLNIDDVGFVNALLDTLFSLRPTDTMRVYATGFSNGALLCFRLASQLSGRFAAIAPVAGDLVYSPWNPSQSVPIISFHSYQDNVIPYGGGSGFPAQDSIFKKISSNYACTQFKDTLYYDTSRYNHFICNGCNCNAVIEEYVSYDGGHSWPGGAAPGPGVAVSNYFSATQLMWDFFKQYTTACALPASAIDEARSREKLQVFPNPVSDRLTLSLPLKNYKLNIYSATGEKVKELLMAPGPCEINCSDLPGGFYFIRVKSEQDLLTVKFIKQ